ncbi:unnamed protein product, partial [Trichobilharzia szidati]
MFIKLKGINSELQFKLFSNDLYHESYSFKEKKSRDRYTQKSRDHDSRHARNRCSEPCMNFTTSSETK